MNLKYNIRKILKESEDEFGWFVPEEKKIEGDEHRYSLIQDTISKKSNYGDWNIFIGNMDGVVYWNNTKHPDYTGLATPEWSEPFVIPIDLEDSNDYYSLTEIETPRFNYELELIHWYNTTYFELVNEILTKKMEELLNNR